MIATTIVERWVFLYLGQQRDPLAIQPQNAGLDAIVSITGDGERSRPRAMKQEHDASDHSRGV